MESTNRTREEHRRWTHRWLSRCVILLAFFLIVLQLFLVSRSVKENRRLAKTYVAYNELDIEKDEYRAGDVVGFNYTRTASKEETYPVLYETIDSFENVDTGDVFPGVSAVRIIYEPGVEHRHGVRKLPDYATPGRYRVEGSIRSQTSRLTSAIPYRSEVFVVKPKQ